MKKRILIEVGHPNDVHQFKHLSTELSAAGWDVLFMAKKKDIVIDLLEAYKLPYRIFGKTPSSMALKFISLPIFLLNYLLQAIKFKPGFIISRNSPFSAYTAKILGVPNFGFADTEISGVVDKLALKFVDYYFTSTSFNKNLGKNHFRYPGYIETWYINPFRFKPNPSVLDDLGVTPGEKFSVIRFVSWKAHHDVGIQGLSDEFKIEIVNKLLNYGKVFISSEKPLPPELEKFKFKLSPEKMHDALYYCSFFYGESATMASETACAGKHAFFIDPHGRGYTSEQELKYNLVSNFSLNSNSIKESISKIDLVFQNEKFSEMVGNNYKSMLGDVVEPVSCFAWLINNYPSSLGVLHQNQNWYQNFMLRKYIDIQ